MNFQRVLIILACFLVYPNTHSDPIIKMTLKPLPKASSFLRSIKKPGHTDQLYINGIINKPTYEGIFSTYAGFLSCSDYNGSTVFPRKQAKNYLYIIITEEIMPIIIMGNTVHHWELVPNSPIAIFKMELKKEAGENIYFWHTTKEELPDKIIPLESIVIFSKPNNIIVNTGISVAETIHNFILPSLYVAKEINIIKTSLYSINLRYLFSNVPSYTKKIPKAYEFSVHT